MDAERGHMPEDVEGQAPRSGQGAGAAESAPAESLHVTPRAAPGQPYTHDKRYETRSARQKRQKAEATARAQQKAERENAILQGVAGGFSMRQIAGQLGISKSLVHQLYRSALERVQGEGIEDFRQAMQFRLQVMLQSRWTAALSGDSRAFNDVLSVCKEMSALEGAYPAQPLEGVLDVTVRREVSLAEVLRTAAEIQADRIARGDAPLPRVVLDASPGGRVLLDATALPAGDET